MPWISVPHLKGKVYVPEKWDIVRAKHGCPDCFACQQCSDERCNACCNASEVHKGENSPAVS